MFNFTYWWKCSRKILEEAAGAEESIGKCKVISNHCAVCIRSSMWAVKVFLRLFGTTTAYIKEGFVCWLDALSFENNYRRWKFYNEPFPEWLNEKLVDTRVHWIPGARNCKFIQSYSSVSHTLRCCCRWQECNSIPFYIKFSSFFYHSRCVLYVLENINKNWI